MMMLSIAVKVEQRRTGKPLSAFLCRLEGNGGVTASGWDHAGGNIAEPE
jgi:hypothetical protein